MNAFSQILPFVGMGATSSNVNGNQLPHTIVALNRDKKEISTTLDSFKVNSETKKLEYTTNRDSEKIEWVLKDHANPQLNTYIPKYPTKDLYHTLIINTKSQYTNPNL